MMIPSGYLLHSHGIDGPNRNRWFTVLKNGGSFHGYVSHNQMVYDVWVTPHRLLYLYLLNLMSLDVFPS